MKTKPHCERKPREYLVFQRLAHAVYHLHQELRGKADQAQVEMDKVQRRLMEQGDSKRPPSKRQTLIGDGLILQHSKARREQTRALDVWNFLDTNHRRLIELMMSKKIK